MEWCWLGWTSAAAIHSMCNMWYRAVQGELECFLDVVL